MIQRWFFISRKFRLFSKYRAINFASNVRSREIFIFSKNRAIFSFTGNDRANNYCFSLFFTYSSIHTNSFLQDDQNPSFTRVWGLGKLKSSSYLGSLLDVKLHHLEGLGFYQPARGLGHKPRGVNVVAPNSVRFGHTLKS